LFDSVNQNGKDGCTVKKLIAMLLLASVIVTGVVGCGGSPTTKAATTPKADTDKTKPGP
jgi:hypothetical protein